MNTNGDSMARDIARAVIDFERQRAGHSPESVGVTLGQSTLVVTLRGALSPAELTMARTAEGVARIEHLQQQLFEAAGDALRKEIQRITGKPIVDASAAVVRGTGSVIRSFPSGTLVQIYLLDGAVPAQHWSGTDPSHPVSFESNLQGQSEIK
jgi:uncharacterized protein YbcI